MLPAWWVRKGDSVGPREARQCASNLTFWWLENIANRNEDFGYLLSKIWESDSSILGSMTTM